MRCWPNRAPDTGSRFAPRRGNKPPGPALTVTPGALAAAQDMGTAMLLRVLRVAGGYAAAQAATDAARRRLGVLAQRSALYGAAAACAAAALGFFAAALWTWVAMTYDSLVASIVLGSAFLLLAAVTLLVLKLSAPARPAAAATLPDPLLASLHAAQSGIASAEQALRGGSGRTYKAAAVAAVTGYALARALSR